jgi:hypothetical protein
MERAGEAETQPLRGIRIPNKVFYLGTLANTLRASDKSAASATAAL